jgi:hypothetical protein
MKPFGFAVLDTLSHVVLSSVTFPWASCAENRGGLLIWIQNWMKYRFCQK